MTVQFEESETWRRRGAPAVEIPAEIAQWMDATYESGKVAVIAAEDDSDTDSFVRLLHIYARRNGKKCDTQFFMKNGASHLRFRMRDARGYTRDVPRGYTPRTVR